MSISLKNAGVNVASKCLRKGGDTNAVIMASKAVSQTVCSAASFSTDAQPPRAVSKDEAPQTTPARESTKTTMMPWKGWVDRFLKDKLSADQYSSYKNTFHFWPEDPYSLQQMPSPSMKPPVTADGKEIGFREVSPGSQPAVDIPLHDLDDDPYDSGYFKKDTRRRYVDPEFPNQEIEQLKLDMQDPNDPEVKAAKEKLAAGPTSSPGNGLRFATGPSDFDPTGLRAVMAVTHAEIEKEMNKHMPDHLPEPTWKNEEEELYNWYKERDLPVPIGGNWNFISKEKRVARW